MISSNWRDWWNELGEDFWKEPSSRRGLHAPGETQGSHARGVFLLAAAHWRRVPWVHVRKNRSLCRSYLRAAMFHDAGKKFDRDRHEAMGFEWMLPRDEVAAFIILSHMGRWGPGVVEKMNILYDFKADHLNNPTNQYLADMVASCDYTQACCFLLR